MARVAAQPYLYHLQSNSALQLKRLRDDVHVFLTEVLLPLMDAIVRAATALLLIGVLLLISPLATLILGRDFRRDLRPRSWFGSAAFPPGATVNAPT